MTTSTLVFSKEASDQLHCIPACLQGVQTASLFCPRPFPCGLALQRAEKSCHHHPSAPTAPLGTSQNHSQAVPQQLEWFLLCFFTTKYPKWSRNSQLKTFWDFARKLEMRVEARPSPQVLQDALRTAERNLLGLQSWRRQEAAERRMLNLRILHPPPRGTQKGGSGGGTNHQEGKKWPQ